MLRKKKSLCFPVSHGLVGGKISLGRADNDFQPAMAEQSLGLNHTPILSKLQLCCEGMQKRNCQKPSPKSQNLSIHSLPQDAVSFCS